MSDPVVVTVLDAEPVTVAQGATEHILVEVDQAAAVTVEVGGNGQVQVDVDQGDSIQIDVTTLGAPGAPGQSARITVTAAEEIPASHVVAINADGTARLASSLNYDDAVEAFGVARTAALSGETFTVATAGSLTTTGTVPVGTLYLGIDGALTTDHEAGLFTLRIGYAPTPDLLVVRVGEPIML